MIRAHTSDLSAGRRTIAGNGLCCWCISLLLLVVCVGCSSEDDGEPSVDRALAPESATTVNEGPLVVDFSVSSLKLVVGEPFEVTIRVEAPNGVEVTMPTLGETHGPFAIIDRSTPPDVPTGDARVWTHTYTCDTFESGDLVFESLAIGYADTRTEASANDGEPPAGAVVLSSMPMTVETVLAATDSDASPRDIERATDVDLDIPFPWLLVGFGVTAGVVLIVIGLFLRRAGRKPLPEPVTPVIPAHIQALRELERLRTDALPEAGAFYEFHSRVSDILRTYIEQQFGLHAPERTTEEFLRDRATIHVLGDVRATMLGSFLRAADMVKFARQDSSVEECDHAYVAARTFVSETADQHKAYGTSVAPVVAEAGA